MHAAYYNITRIPLIGAVEVEPPLEGIIRRFDGGQLLELHERSVHPVLPVPQLYQVTIRVPNGPVVVHHEPFHGLDQTTLDVPRLGGLDGRVDETLATAHGVEVELVRSETGQVGVLHEAFALGTVVVLDEVRQGAVTEAEWDSLPLNVLLTNTGNDLQRNNIITQKFNCTCCQFSPLGTNWEEF